MESLGHFHNLAADAQLRTSGTTLRDSCSKPRLIEMTETTTTTTTTETAAQTSHSSAQVTTTTRKDNWWVEPALVFIGFTGFIIYATWRAFENQFYEVGNYLSPFYSPKLIFSWWHFSPALLILWVPAGFRATCYYYRKAYYRAYFLDPPGCSVSHSGVLARLLGVCGSKYFGETSFPFIFQNAHRYFFYLATVVLAFLWYDAYKAFFDTSGNFSVTGLNLFMLLNVVLLSGYSSGCHACRHLVGGNLDCFSSCPSAKRRHGIWHFVTKLNEHHQLWAWMSLFSVGLTDLFVRQVSSGVFPDFKVF